MIRIAVLSLSLLTVMSGAAVAPAVADIIAYFPDASPLLGKMVLTTPALTIIPVALITGIMSRRVSRKRLVYVGILFYIVGGTGGKFFRIGPKKVTRRYPPCDAGGKNI